MARSREKVEYTLTAKDATAAGINAASRGFQRLDGLVGKIAGSIGLSAAGITALPSAIVAATAPAINELNKLSAATGVSVGYIQAARSQATAAGKDFDMLADAFREGLKRISEYTELGSGPAAEALALLGLEADKLRAMKPEERLTAIYEGLDKVADRADRMLIADELFGEPGIQMLDAGLGKIRETQAELEATGRALTSLDAAGVRQMTESFNELRGGLSTTLQLFTAGLAPGVDAVLQTVLDLVGGIDGARSAGELMGESLVTVVGGVGDEFERVANLVGAIGVGIQYIALVDDKVKSLFGDPRDVIAFREEYSKFLDSYIALSEKVHTDDTFSDRLNIRLEEIRAEAEKKAVELDRIAGRVGSRSNRQSVLALTVDADTTPAEEKLDQFRTRFESLEFGQLGGEDRINAVLEQKLATIADYRTAFPDEIGRVLAAEMAAYDERDRALKELADKRTEEQAALQQPLLDNLDAVREQFQTEREVIEEETQKKIDLLKALAADDIGVRQEVSDLVVQLRADEVQKLAEIDERAAEQRARAQQRVANQIIGDSTKVLAFLSGNEKQARKIEAIGAKARALMAGGAAAEKARESASIFGPGAGQAAYALSWAGTLATVAGIDSAASGGTPGGGGGGAGGGSSRTAAAAERPTLAEPRLLDGATRSTNVVIMPITDTRLIDEDKWNTAMLNSLEEFDKDLVTQITQDDISGRQRLTVAR